MCDQFLLTLECCVHVFGGEAVPGLLAGWSPPPFAPTVEPPGVTGSLYVWPLGGDPLLRLHSCLSSTGTLLCGEGSGGREAGAKVGGNAGVQACGQESKGGGPGYFSCSLLAEVLVLTAGEWDLSEPRDSG